METTIFRVLRKKGREGLKVFVQDLEKITYACDEVKQLIELGNKALQFHGDIGHDKNFKYFDDRDRRNLNFQAIYNAIKFWDIRVLGVYNDRILPSTPDHAATILQGIQNEGIDIYNERNDNETTLRILEAAGKHLYHNATKNYHYNGPQPHIGRIDDFEMRRMEEMAKRTIPINKLILSEEEFKKVFQGDFENEKDKSK